MTERKGGSDVSDGTETEAVLQSENLYKLHGYKWFSSATDSDMTITLARVLDKDNKVCQKSNFLIILNRRKILRDNYVNLKKILQPDKRLTMFFARVRKDDGSLNGIEIQTLKNKLGTRQVPTGELLLDGMDAYRVSISGIKS